MWRLLHEPYRLWVRVIKSKYGELSYYFKLGQGAGVQVELGERVEVQSRGGGKTFLTYLWEMGEEG